MLCCELPACISGNEERASWASSRLQAHFVEAVTSALQVFPNHPSSFPKERRNKKPKPENVKGTGEQNKGIFYHPLFTSAGLPDFFFLILFIYLFLAVLGLHFCARAFSSCGKRGPLFIAVRGPLTIVASLVAEHRLQTRRLSSCGSRAQLLCGMWDLPRPGLEPASPALAGRFSTTAPPGKPGLPDF